MISQYLAKVDPAKEPLRHDEGSSVGVPKLPMSASRDSNGGPDPNAPPTRPSVVSSEKGRIERHSNVSALKEGDDHNDFFHTAESFLWNAFLFLYVLAGFLFVVSVYSGSIVVRFGRPEDNA